MADQVLKLVLLILPGGPVFQFCAIRNHPESGQRPLSRKGRGSAAVCARAPTCGAAEALGAAPRGRARRARRGAPQPEQRAGGPRQGDGPGRRAEMEMLIF